jgi:hypothetical protein
MNRETIWTIDDATMTALQINHVLTIGGRIALLGHIGFGKHLEGLVMRMKTLKSVLLAAVLSIGLAGCAVGTRGLKAPGDPVAISDLPQAVVDGVQKEMPGAVLAKARKQSDGNYHLTDVKLGKQEYDLTVSADGKVLQKEEDND